VLVGPETADDAGVYLLDGHGLVATADFITPVCDDPRRFGRVAAANALSDVFAMGGEVLFALNLCCFPEKDVPEADLEAILVGAAQTLAEAGGVLLGGHSVRDPELKFGLAVVGRADPDRLMTNAAARPGERLILTKPLGTGVLINAFKAGRIDEAGLEPALAGMERLNREASRLALDHGVRAATDVTGFGLAGHALEMAQASGVTLEIDVDAVPLMDEALDMYRRGMTTGVNAVNRQLVEGKWRFERQLPAWHEELFVDPQTSGPLLAALPSDQADGLVEALHEAGIPAARRVGSVLDYDGQSRLVFF
jgi:selenide, water dikinase